MNILSIFLVLLVLLCPVIFGSSSDLCASSGQHDKDLDVTSLVQIRRAVTPARQRAENKSPEQAPAPIHSGLSAEEKIKAIELGRQEEEKAKAAADSDLLATQAVAQQQGLQDPLLQGLMEKQNADDADLAKIQVIQHQESAELQNILMPPQIDSRPVEQKFAEDGWRKTVSGIVNPWEDTNLESTIAANVPFDAPSRAVGKLTPAASVALDLPSDMVASKMAVGETAPRPPFVIFDEKVAAEKAWKEAEGATGTALYKHWQAKQAGDKVAFKDWQKKKDALMKFKTQRALFNKKVESGLVAASAAQAANMGPSTATADMYSFGNDPAQAAYYDMHPGTGEWVGKPS